MLLSVLLIQWLGFVLSHTLALFQTGGRNLQALLPRTIAEIFQPNACPHLMQGSGRLATFPWQFFLPGDLLPLDAVGDCILSVEAQGLSQITEPAAVCNDMLPQSIIIREKAF